MAATDPTAVIRRLLEDDYVHEQLAEASAGVRGAYRRARRLPPDKAVQDKKVYERVRQATTGVVGATRGVLAKPEPKRKRGRRLLAALVLLATGAVVVWAAKREGRTAGGGTGAGAADTAPVAPG
jgi:hypothetical protein